MQNGKQVRIAIFHYSIKVVSRSQGRSVVACAAYRAGVRLVDHDTGKVHDFTRKGGVIYSEILLPSHAPESYNSRQTLWDSVSKVECKSNSQLAREVEMALPKELSREKQIELVRSYIKAQFISKGMCADWALHDRRDGNPHVHILLTVRGINSDGAWSTKERKTYKLDSNGDRIPIIDPKTGKQKIGARGRKLWQRETVQVNQWNSRENAEIWRAAWAKQCNQFLGCQAVDHRSYARQKKEIIPTIHEGFVARQIEQKGSISERCEQNRVVRRRNALKLQLVKIIGEIQDVLLRKADDIIGREKYEHIRTADQRERRSARNYTRTRTDDFETLIRAAEISRLTARTDRLSGETKQSTGTSRTDQARSREHGVKKSFEAERTSHDAR